MQLVVFEDAGYRNLLPLACSRATFDLRCGYGSLIETLETVSGRTTACVFVRPSLAEVIAERQPRRVNQPATADDQLWVNGRFLSRSKLDLPENSAAWSGETLLAARLPRAIACRLDAEVLLDLVRLKSVLSGCCEVEVPADAGTLIEYPWHLVRENEKELRRQADRWDFRIEGEVCDGAHLLNESAIHVGVGTRIKPAAVLDAEDGAIHIGDHVLISPNVTITGPCYIGDDCVIQPGASICGGTSMGPVCKVGGETEGTLFQGYANKQHDGFLGHSYVGEWVNLGADTVNSDLKNTYGPVRVELHGKPVDTGETFVGAFIGDHTKTGINVALPTGCVIGFACNVFVSGHAPKFVPDFSWVTDEGVEVNDPARALAVARKVVARRDRSLSPAEERLFISIHKSSRRT